MGNWSNIPQDIARKIAMEHLENVDDFEAFGKVRSVFYSLSKRMFCKVEVPQLDHDDEDDHRMYYSLKGWLISVSRLNRSITLFNPFSVAMMFDKTQKLAFWKPGQLNRTKPTHVDFEIDWVLDVCFHRGEFFAIDHRGLIMAFGNNTLKPRIIANLGPNDKTFGDVRYVGVISWSFDFALIKSLIVQHCVSCKLSAVFCTCRTAFYGIRNSENKSSRKYVDDDDDDDEEVPVKTKKASKFKSRRSNDANDGDDEEEVDDDEREEVRFKARKASINKSRRDYEVEEEEEEEEEEGVGAGGRCLLVSPVVYRFDWEGVDQKPLLLANDASGCAK
ncbi:Methionyl-tRNA formyltransferase [Bienertia sinuspersici]